MVNDTENSGDAERALAISYAAAGARPALAALLSLDDRLGAIVRRAREPIIGQMRLTWWFEALAALDAGPPPAEPVLRALAAHVLPAGVKGGELAGMIDGWEPLIDAAALDDEGLEAIARERGGRLFTAAATTLGQEDAGAAMLGEGWALANLATHWGRPEAASMARERLDAALGRPWSTALRPLGALGLLARADLMGRPPGSPARVGRLLWHRLTGR